jgi:hypothetical protein
LREEFDRLFKGYVTDMGLNRIYYQIGEQQILVFLTTSDEPATQEKDPGG